MKILENFMKVINFRNTRLLYFIIVFLYSPVVLFAQSSADVQAYIAKYRDLALEQENRYGIPASITLAFAPVVVNVTSSASTPTATISVMVEDAVESAYAL